ncbi:MAG: AraC family transcriptional regulator [Gemmiger sp.]|nr:AraC family transcriptional regulator [Gemmiger sp.]
MLPFYEKKDVFSIGQGRSLVFPPHLHHGIELIYAHSDGFSLSVGRHSYHLGTGDLALIFPNTVHSFNTPAASFTLLIDPPNDAGPFSAVLMAHHPACPILRAAQLHPDIPWAIEALRREYQGANDGYVVQALVQLLLARALPCLELKKNNVEDAPGIISQLMAYLGEHFREPLSLDELAAHFSVSKYYLSRLFSSRIGLSLPQYLNECRLNAAISALCSTDAPITDIWNDAGYESQRSFNRAFKTRYGASPREYRRTHRYVG